MKPASIARRFFAALFDYGIILIVTGVYINIYGTPDGNGDLHVSGFKALPIFILWFLMVCVTEHFFGATIGNGMLQLKPVTLESLHKPTLGQTIKRHLLDPVDMFFFGLVAVVAIKNTPHRQRLGDQWAGTTVVKE